MIEAGGSARRRLLHVVWVPTAVALLAAGCSSYLRTGGSPRATGGLHASGASHEMLTGRIWDVGSKHYVDVDALVARLTRARYVLLGERHDDPEHHRLQARLLAAMVAAGRRPTLALEMLDPADDAIVARFVAGPVRDTSELAAELDWSKRGWPSWAVMRPAVDVAVKERLAIVSANFSKDLLAELRRGPLDAATARHLAIDRPLPARVRGAMEEEIRQAHCGHASPAMVETMVTIQRARDAVMARSMVDGERGDGAVLLAGAGHVRTDRGVPVHLARLAPGADTVALAFVEVTPDLESPVEAAADDDPEDIPYDFVWFTPAIERPDPCVEFEKQLERLRTPKAGSTPK